MPEALKRSHDAAKAPLPVLLIVTHGAGRLPPSGSTAGSALVSPTPPQGGSDTGAPYASLKITPPLEGESQKPSRQAKADAVGGGRRPGKLRAATRPGRFSTVLIY